MPCPYAICMASGNPAGRMGRTAVRPYIETINAESFYTDGARNQPRFPLNVTKQNVTKQKTPYPTETE